MPTPSSIDIDALLQPIPGDNPAGGPLPAEPTRRNWMISARISIPLTSIRAIRGEMTRRSSVRRLTGRA